MFSDDAIASTYANMIHASPADPKYTTTMAPDNLICENQ